MHWQAKAALAAAAARARDDDAFRQTVAPVFKVGPKGYIHGWIFVGAPGVGARVFHPQKGMGTVTAHDGKHATVKFDKTGATHTFEAREHTAKGKLVRREEHEGKKLPEKPDRGNVGGVDQEKKPSKPRVAKKPVEGIPEGEKIDTPYGKLHPADVALQHPGYLNSQKDLQAAKTELERRGVTEGGRDKVSQTHKKISAKLERSIAYEKEYNKPGGRGDMVKARQEADRLSEEADKKGTAAAHEAAAAANGRALTLSYRHEPGQSLTHEYLNTRIKVHDAKAADLRAKEPKSLDQRRKEYNAAAERAKSAEFGTSGLDQTGASHDRAAAAHDRAAAAAVTDKQRATHEAKAAAFREQAKNLREGKNVDTGGKEKTPDDLSKKAKRTGKREDHVAAHNAQLKAGNEYKADDHRRAVASIDDSNEYKDEGDEHAAAAEKSHDPDDHEAAAESYKNAAEHMDDVPGGKKAAAALRAKADEHHNTAVTIAHKTAQYVKAFLSANKKTNAANRSRSIEDHKAAAAAHREAAALAMYNPQRRYHEDQARVQETKARSAKDGVYDGPKEGKLSDVKTQEAKPNPKQRAALQLIADNPNRVAASQRKGADGYHKINGNVETTLSQRGWGTHKMVEENGQRVQVWELTDKGRAALAS